MMQRDSTVVWPTRLIYQCMHASAWIDAFAACQVKSAYFLSEKKKESSQPTLVENESYTTILIIIIRMNCTLSVLKKMNPNPGLFYLQSFFTVLDNKRYQIVAVDLATSNGCDWSVLHGTAGPD